MSLEVGGYRLVLYALAAVTSASASAQTLPLDPPAYAPLRYDDSARSTPIDGFGTGLKDIRIGSGVRVSFGGELRERFEHYHDELFGLGPVIDDDYDLSRLLVFADLRTDGGVRAFVEIGSYSAIGKRNPLLETDRNDFGVEQAFVDLPVRAATVRIGRQEMALGSARFVDYREGPNVRLSFDGIRANVPLNGAMLTLFDVKPIQIRPGAFDDGPTRGYIFAGAYLSVPISGARPGPFFELGSKPALAIDTYYYWHETRRREGGARRHTIGLRGSGASAGWDYDIEGIWQLGRSLIGRVDAGGVSERAGYTFAGLAWSPRLGIQSDWLSGDRHADDGRDNTTDPLFPRGVYFSEPGLQTFSNIADVYPSLTLDPTGRLAVQGGFDFIWRASTDGAVYIAPLVPVPGTAGVGGRYVGISAVLQRSWTATPNLSVAFSLVRMSAGDAITAAGGHGLTYLATWIRFQF